MITLFEICKSWKNWDETNKWFLITKTNTSSVEQLVMNPRFKIPLHSKIQDCLWKCSLFFSLNSYVSLENKTFNNNIAIKYLWLNLYIDRMAFLQDCLDFWGVFWDFFQISWEYLVEKISDVLSLPTYQPSWSTYLPKIGSH